MIRFDQIVNILRKNTKQSPEPMTHEIVSLYEQDPYFILISCLLSLQNRDVVTLPVSIALFKRVTTPKELLVLSLEELELIIKSINYYKTKARTLRSVSQEILDRFEGKVPQTLEELLSMKGVGIKTANLVLAEAFNIPAICVDTHVHRLSNHWQLVSTKTPEQTERALREVLPQEYWIDWNYLLVKWGQSFCKKNKDNCQICAPIIDLIKQEPKK